jgi:hypothetical protein
MLLSLDSGSETSRAAGHDARHVFASDASASRFSANPQPSSTRPPGAAASRPSFCSSTPRDPGRDLLFFASDKQGIHLFIRLIKNQIRCSAVSEVRPGRVCRECGGSLPAPLADVIQREVPTWRPRARRARRELALGPAGADTAEQPGHYHHQGSSRPSDPRGASGLWPPVVRSGGFYDGAHSAARRPLVRRGPVRKTRARVWTVPMPVWVKVAIDAGLFGPT